MSIDTMKQALEALEMLAKWEHPASNITTKSGRIYPHHVAKNSAATLRLAIEQAERQEPVAWVCEGSSSDEKHAIDYQQEDVDAIPIGTMLYTAPPQREPHELLCVCGASWSIDGEGNEELLSTPPQRQPLTEEEIRSIDKSTHFHESPDWEVRFARAIERKHGIGGGE